MEKKYTHSGKLEKAESGVLVITAENGARYTVDNGVAAIWTSFDGKTVEEVTQLVAGGNSPEEAKKAVQQVTEKLVELDVLRPGE